MFRSSDPSSKTTRVQRCAVLLFLVLMLLPGGIAQAASLENPPERLYFLAAEGVPAEEVPQPFTGTDPISVQPREIVVEVLDGGCDPKEANGYSDADCASVKLDLTTAGAGMLSVTSQEKEDDKPLFAEGGAIIVQSSNNDGTGTLIRLVGTQAQLRASLPHLGFTPEMGYENTDDTPAVLKVTVVDGGPTAERGPMAEHEVEIRVAPANEWPQLIVPGSTVMVDAGGTVSLPADEPLVGDTGDFSVSDPDIDDDRMLLVMFTTCGEFSLA